MPDMNPRPHTSRVFYGWYILIGYFFLLFFQAGARHSFGVMFKPMIAQLSWNRASISLAFGFTLLITAPLTVTLVGRLYGFTHIGLLSGFITTIHHFGGGFWAYMGGLTRGGGGWDTGGMGSKLVTTGLTLLG